MTGRKRGRPRKPADKLQAERLWFYATQEEADRILRRAVRRGETLSEYIRRRLESELAADSD